jgi:hypothetical protein
VGPACLKVLGLPPFRNVMLQRAIMSVALFNRLFVCGSDYVLHMSSLCCACDECLFCFVMIG